MRDDDTLRPVFTLEQLLYGNDPDYPLPACATPLLPAFCYVARDGLVELLELNIAATRQSRLLPGTPAEVAEERDRHLAQLQALLAWVRGHRGTKVWIGWFPSPEYEEQQVPSGGFSFDIQAPELGFLPT
jgi:hypothetical protein